ncbi:MAG: carbamoyltransferase HypF, partial [Nitrospirae bacterium]|nr:carbamoyltransferase HypF [Nitrospirota bacterium]
MNRVLINIKGLVQGVGFRPFVYNLAKSLNLKGSVANTADGVTIDVEGDDVTFFIEMLSKEAPPLSKMINVDITPMPFCGYEGFEILKSKDNGSSTLISPDISVCDDCLKEMFDKTDRRYLYPFINCTNCGPRYTITNAVPYDRQNTTMSVFRMCPECEAEYNNPGNRRFHAQPNACPVCGPEVKLVISHQLSAVSQDQNPIETAIQLVKEGKIIAVKGLGGFHIGCDAKNKDAVERLRLAKRKSNKPFALMAPDIWTIEKYCEVSEEEKKILNSNKRPVVLLRKRADAGSLPDAVSPDNQYLGFMLPYTPLHYLLFYYSLSGLTADSYQLLANFDALIMTSGNLSEEPIVIDNNETISKLSDIADAFLIHNRDIFMRTDDSVVRSHFLRHKAKPLFIRRSRGYAPDPIFLNDDGPEVLGCGADIKNTFTLTKGSYAIPSQHIGDMENYETVKFFEESLRNLKAVYRANPVAIAYDLHPNYFSTQWALAQSQISNLSPQANPPEAGKSQIQYFGIQHHYAHIASVMAENGIKKKVMGVAFDGTGYGADGNLWGSEFLIADPEDFKRAGHFKYIPLPGGEMAVREPWRVAVSYIKDIAGDEAMHYLGSIGFIEKYGKDNIDNILKIIDNREFSPLSSSAGRLFDAVSAMLGICDRNTFEGEAAMALESYAAYDIDDDYPVDVIFKEKIIVDFSLTILRLIEDIRCGTARDIITAKFHNTIVTVIERVILKLSTI